MELRARVIELESEATASIIRAVELAEASREPDRYRVLLQSAAAQVQGLQDDYADIFSRSRSSQSSLRDRLMPLLSMFILSSPPQ